jgi:antitoxin (DNA-binding transcriptional repressor) of toxin-antitoxin stability system
MQFNVHEAKSNLSRLIDLAEAGEEVIIARHGKPAVKLEKVHVPTERVLGLGHGEWELPDSGWQGPLSDEEIDDLLEGR